MKGFCPNCFKEVELEIETRLETYPVKGEPTTVEAQVCVCPDCKNDVWVTEYDEANLERANNVYKKKHGLLLPSRIKQIREGYGLTQTAFSKILGFGEKTIARYENGYIQDEAHNNLLLLVSDVDNFCDLYRRQKGKLTTAEQRQFEGKVRRDYGVWNMDYTLSDEDDYYMCTEDKNGVVLPFKARGLEAVV